jgi:hydrophobe/amphiphile efflux-3 (HAE3) family protein
MSIFENLMENVSKLVTRFPKITIAICLSITAVFATQLPKLVVDASIKGQFPQDFPARLEMDALEEQFGGSEIVLLGIEADNIYTRETLELIQRLTETIEEFEEVDDVVSLFTVNDIVGTEEGMEVYELIEEFPETDEDVQALRGRMRANPLFWNNVIADDETATAIVATITTEAKDDVVHQQFQALFDQELASQKGPNSPQLYLGGMPVTRAMIVVDIVKNMRRFLPAGLFLMIILLYVSFRSLRGIFLPFTVVIMSIICTFGLMGLIGKPITMIGMIIPVMLIAIANDYSIHIVARYYEDVKAHLEQLSTQAVTVKVMKRLGIPILLAGVTTVVGFGSLLTHIMPPAKDLGILASFGIVLAFLFSITFTPAWLSLLPIPKVLAERKHTDRLGSLLEWVSQAIGQHPTASKVLVVAGVCIAIASATGIPKIVVDTNMMNYYKDDYPLVVSTNLLNAKLGGAITVNMIFDGDIKDPAVLQKIEEVQRYMDTLPQVGKTISMVDYLKQMNKAMHADAPEYYVIPESKELVAQYLLLYTISGDPEDFDRVVDYEYRKGQLIGRVNVTGTTDIAEVVAQIETYIAQNFSGIESPKVDSITGFSVLFKELIPLVVKGQIRSLFLSLAVIFVLGALSFRSWVAGLFTVYPISVAMLIVFGLMGYQGIELNITTAMLSSILIGVGVDYTLHFLYHYREEVQHYGYSPAEALRVTLTTSGKGIIYNAMSVIVGFCVMMLSSFLPVYFFGWLLTFSIVACLIGALTLLPAAILVFKPKFIFVAPYTPNISCGKPHRSDQIRVKTGLTDNKEIS